MTQLSIAVRNVSDAQLQTLREIFGEVEYEFEEEGKFGSTERLKLSVETSTVAGDPRIRALLTGIEVPSWVWHMPTGGWWTGASGNPSGSFSIPHSAPGQRRWNEKVIDLGTFTRERSDEILEEMERPHPRFWVPAAERKPWQRHLPTHPDEVYRAMHSFGDRAEGEESCSDVRVSRSLVAPAWHGLPGMKARTMRYLEVHRGFETPESYAAQLELAKG